ncbi:Nn.00g084110.m01.CDS01 [Neocucurbitaria sp. VM-36]
MDEDLRILEQEYCPPIDPGLISAIYFDYVGQENARDSARQLLNTLKATAAEEALTDFNPSGYSEGPGRDSPGKNSTDAESNADTWATQTVLTDTSNLSNDISTLGLGERSGNGSEGSNEGGYFKDTEHFDTPTKELLLAETFPSLSLERITYTLKKCGNDFSKATDELLNHVYFEDTRASPAEEGPVAKGIDAFSEAHHIPQRGKKGKAKKKKQSMYSTDTTYSSGSEASIAPPTNRWLNTSRDVEFITSRTSISAKTVSSLYHSKGASLSATVLEIVRNDIKAHVKDGEPDAALVQDAITLNADFTTIDLQHALALVRLAAPSASKARDLAKALTEQPASETGGKGGIKLDLRYAPINLSDPTSEPSKLPTLAPSARPRDVASTARARSEAFQNASAAYRKGRSTPLMKAAAGYYAQEGRDLNANLKAMNAAEADAFVSAQSGPTYLDLHGVTVADATRIAKHRTQIWWNSLGERKIPEWSGAGRRGGGDAYRIITGLGRHSEGGRGKLGPAVAKTLVKEGWKVEVDSGELLVTGLARRR